MKQAAEKYVRMVGGNLVSSVITETKNVRIEVLRRNSPGRIHWHFRQPELCLFWYSKGAERLNATIDGRPVDRLFSRKSSLAIFPAATEIQGEWSIASTLDYTVVFLNPALVKEHLDKEITQPTVGFEHDELTRGLAVLCREASSPDSMLGLLVEGWSMQALAHMARVSRGPGSERQKIKGGLSRRSANLINEYIQANLAKNISLEELSGLACLSKRHFMRAFCDTFGSTPYRFVLALKIEEAKRRLSQSSDSILDVGMSVGFTHVEHFSTTFRKIAGLSPSDFRRRFS